MHHLCSKNTFASTQTYPVKLNETANYNNTFRAFIEAKFSMILSK